MAASDDEIIVTLTMQAAQFQQAAQEAGVTTEGLAAQLKAANIDIVGQGAALMRLDAAFAAPINTAKQLAAAEAALDAAMRTGAITAEQQAAYLDQLSASQAAVAETAELATAATEELSAAQTISGGVAREIGVLMGELARGNYTRLEGSTITLANRTGVLSSALSFLISPAGLVAAAIAGAGVAAVKGAEDFLEFQNIVALTNGAVGMSAGELQQMADNIGHATKDSGDATEALQKLAASGRFAGDQLDQAATSAVQFAQATGMKVEQVTALLIRMATDPKAPLDELTNSLHILSDAQAQEVRDLIATGDKAGASAVEIQAFAQRAQEASGQVQSSMNPVVGFFKDLGHNIAEASHNLVEFMNVATGGGDAAAKLGVINREIASIEGSYRRFIPTVAAQLPILEHQREVLQQQLDVQKQQEQQAQRTATQLKDMVPQKGTFDAMKKEGLGGLDLAGNLKQQLAAMEDAENISYQQREAFNREYWGYVLANTKDGTAAHIEALQEVDQIQQRSDQEMERSVEAQARQAKEASRQQAEAARQAAAAHRQMAAQVMNDLEEQRAATVANTAERIQADATILASATRLYGAMSSEQRRAVQQMIADGRSYDAAVLQQQEAALQTQMRVDQAAANEKRAAAQQALAEGQITAQQALAIEQAANQQALNSYAQYIAAKVALDQGSIPALNKDAQDWVSFSASMTKRMQQDQQTATRQIQQQWMQTFRPITQAFDQSITGMIQGTKTLSQAWRSLLSDLLMSEVRSGAQMVARWAATELAKTGATMAGNAARTASNEAAARIGMQQSAEVSEKQIFNAAYTAAANTYQSVSQIPYVGWIMAPIAAAGAFTAVMAFDNIASAAGGWGSVPYDDAPALLHRNEMVLPATLADRVRGMTDAGGATGGNQNIHVHANDARSFGQLLQRDPHMFAKAAKKAMRVQRNRP